LATTFDFPTFFTQAFWGSTITKTGLESGLDWNPNSARTIFSHAHPSAQASFSIRTFRILMANTDIHYHHPIIMLLCVNTGESRACIPVPWLHKVINEK